MEESKPHVVVVPSHWGRAISFHSWNWPSCSPRRASLVSYITTPGSAKRLQPQVQGSNLDIRLVSLPLPPIDGVPPGIDSSDNVPFHVAEILFSSSHKLAGPFEQWLDGQMNNIRILTRLPIPLPPPICIISDMFTGWVHSSGAKFGIPTVVFHTSGAFAMSVMHSVFNYTPQKSVEGDDEYFEVPELSFDLKLRKSDLP
jgi:hypothetical protein